MTWDDVLDRLTDAGLTPVEETYMENYGKVLAAQQPRFSGRNFRCSCGVISCKGLRIEVLLFPSEVHLDEFLELVGDDPWWVRSGNAVVHFPESDPAILGSIVDALSSGVR